ncbi:MAG: class I SAM-dependent methyltransferase [Nitrososphaerales archaeon]
MIYLNLGCYDKPFPKPFINVDIRESEDCHPDVVDNAFTLSKFENESVQLIYSSHMLEHLNFSDGRKALERWYEVLQPGGELRLAVPDMEACFAHYFYWKDIKLLHSMLWGSQRGHDYDYHLSGYTKESLTEVLMGSGFIDIKPWNYWDTYPNQFIDDYAKSCHPSMMYKQKKARGGVVDFGAKDLSLNLCGFKPNV